MILCGCEDHHEVKYLFNSIDIYCFDNRAAHVINDHLVLVADSLRQKERNLNNKIPLSSGKILIQSEGAEIFYRDIWIQSIEKFPY